MIDWNVHWLDASGDMAEWKLRIFGQIRLANEALTTFVAPPAIDILIERGSEGTTPEIAMVVRVNRSNMITMRIDPYNDNFEDILANGCFQRQIVRAVHQSMRTATAGYGFTLGGALVSEGLAGQFVRLVYANDPEPWEIAITGAALGNFWPEQAELMTPKYDHAVWFSGSGDKPRWLGYSLGFRLVENWLVSGAPITPQRMIEIPAPKVLSAALAKTLVS